MKKECFIIKCWRCRRSKITPIEDLVAASENWFLEVPKIYCPKCKWWLPIDIKEVDYEEPDINDTSP